MKENLIKCQCSVILSEHFIYFSEIRFYYAFFLVLSCVKLILYYCYITEKIFYFIFFNFFFFMLFIYFLHFPALVSFILPT